MKHLAILLTLLLGTSAICMGQVSSKIVRERKKLYSTTAFQTSDVRFLVNTSVHSAGRTTGNEEPESFSLG